MHQPYLSDHLNLNELGAVGRLSPARAQQYAEAAAVSLQRASHLTGVSLPVSHNKELKAVQVWWNAVHAHAEGSYDQSDAQDDGASAIALLLSRSLLGFEYLCRSYIGSGFDFLLQATVATDGQIRHKTLAKLEVSGIGAHAQRQKIERRVKVKQQQVTSKDQLLLWIVAVVDFRTPQAVVNSGS